MKRNKYHFYWERIAPFLLVSPSIIAVGVFVYGFIAWTGIVSLSKWNQLLPNYAFAGLHNYIKLFADPRFQIDLRNILVFTGVFLVSSLFIGFLLAVLLDQRIHGENFFRTVYIYPMSLSFIVTGVVWRWLLNPGSLQMGSAGVNQLFDMIGLGFLKNGWYTNPKVGIIAVAVAATWQMSGYIMAMYLAGLRGISEELREAARIDGASETQIYLHVVLPLLRPVTLGAIIILIVISLKVYDLIVAMTGPGIGFSCDVPAYYMWVAAFHDNRFAYGSAIAIIILIAVSVFIVPYLIYNLRKEAHS